VGKIARVSEARKVVKPLKKQKRNQKNHLLFLGCRLFSLAPPKAVHAA
jgi:hypothetical protein